MTTTSRPEPPFDRPDVLIAAVPAVLGFVPEDSLVLVTIADGELGAVLRIDLPGENIEAVRELAEVAAVAGADVAIAVIVDADGAECRLCADEYRMLAQLLSDDLAEYGVELIASHVVDVVAAGGQWYCADGCGMSGRVADPTASPVALAAVLDGRRLYPRRSDLLAVVAPTDPDRAAGLARRLAQEGRRPAAPMAGSAGADAQVRSAVNHALRCTDHIQDGCPLDDDDLVALARALMVPQVRDTLYALAVGERAGQAESLWAELARCLPGPWRADALVLLAFSSYVRGDGPLAGIALDAALDCAPGHTMAEMLDEALQSGIRPEVIRELSQTGYRHAAQLGLRLPARRRSGRWAG